MSEFDNRKEELDAEKEQDISKVPKHLQPHVFKKGQSGNPAGRPPTSTLKEFARRYLAGLTDEERIEYFEGIDKKTIWEMAEGKAEAKTELKADVDLTFKWASDTSNNNTVLTEEVG